MKSIKISDPRQWSELPIPSNSQLCGCANNVRFYGQSSLCVSSWAVIMTGVLPCGDFSMCGLLQSSNIGFASQPFLDEIISCPPPPPHQSWVICTQRFAIPPSAARRDCGMEPQLLDTSVTRASFQELQTLSWAASNKHTHLTPWISFLPHRVKFPSCQTPSSTLSKASVEQGETSLSWGKLLAHHVTSACRCASAHTQQ